MIGWDFPFEIRCNYTAASIESQYNAPPLDHNNFPSTFAGRFVQVGSLSQLGGVLLCNRVLLGLGRGGCVTGQIVEHVSR